ncbi:MAG: dipeptidase, partial [Anaeroplasmataceae bacterium]|nr:dipeptidase [Anaeroplasmataceae bacterium]
MNYVDLHCDTILALFDQKELKLKNAPLQINIDKLEEGNALLQCFAMFIHLKTTNEPFKKCIEMIDRYYQEVALNEDKIAPVFQYSDIEKNCSLGKISSLLTIEEGGVTEGNLSYLRILHRLGVRMICLNWNFINGVGHPNFTLSEHPNFHSFNVTEGLTTYGLSMIEEMNRLGII